jgi:hypothetical protein
VVSLPASEVSPLKAFPNNHKTAETHFLYVIDDGGYQIQLILMTNKRYRYTDNDRRQRCSTRPQAQLRNALQAPKFTISAQRLRDLRALASLIPDIKPRIQFKIRHRSRTEGNKGHFPNPWISNSLSSETPHLFQYGKPKERSLMYMIRYPSNFRSRISGLDDRGINKHVRFGPCHSHCCHPVGRRWRF